MSSIKIEKVGITKVGTEFLVNAANENLWAGGGVCGVIFTAAGPCTENTGILTIRKAVSTIQMS